MSSFWEIVLGHYYAVTIVEVGFFAILALVLAVVTITGTIVLLEVGEVWKGIGTFLGGTLLTFLSYCATVYFIQFL